MVRSVKGCCGRDNAEACAFLDFVFSVVDARKTCDRHRRLHAKTKTRRANQARLSGGYVIVAHVARVLIVGDSEYIRQKFAGIMSAAGSQVTCAATGIEVLRLASSRAFDVVLLDADHLIRLVARAPLREVPSDALKLAPPREPEAVRAI